MFAPSCTWAHLFPSGTRFVGVRIPESLRDFAFRTQIGDEKRVLLAWKESRASLPNLDPYSGVVAINCRSVGVRELKASGFNYVRRFAAFPSFEDAQWFIPLDTPVISSQAFCLYTPLLLRAQIKSLGVRSIARAGLPLWYRDQITIAQRTPPPLEQTFQSVFPKRSIRLALSSGARAADSHRKPSIAAINRNGKVLGFGRLAGSPLSERSLQNEAEILPILAHRFGREWLGPKLLFSGDIDDNYAIVVSPVGGRLAGLKLSPGHHRFLSTLRSNEMKPAAATKLVRRLFSRVITEPDIKPLFDTISPILEKLAIPSTIVHGDFAPWNIRKRPDGIVAFDWEAAELDGIPLFDELNHLLMVGSSMKRWTIDQAYERLTAFAASAPIGLCREQVLALEIVYLLTSLFQLRDAGYADDNDVVSLYRQLLMRL